MTKEAEYCAEGIVSGIDNPDENTNEIISSDVWSSHQKLFVDTYLNKNGSLLVLGETIDIDYNKTELLGSAAEVAIKTATHVYSTTTSVIIIPNEDRYQLSLTASPLASYLDIPILIYDNNTDDLNIICSTLNVSNAFIISDLNLNLFRLSLQIYLKHPLVWQSSSLHLSV